VVVPAAERHLLDGTHLFNYYFCWEAETAAIALGYGSLYNNSSCVHSRVSCDVTPLRLWGAKGCR
ncbi:MAG: hypothetical protein ACRDRO_18830, partial [Pseudonocardiaceae bacterium]